MNSITNWLFEAYHYFTGENVKTAEGKALFADRIVETIMGATALGIILYNSLNSRSPILANILLLLIAIRFYESRRSVGQELKISIGLYPEGHIPDNMAQGSHLSIALQITIFIVAYMVIGLSTGNILLSSSLMLLISCFDYRTRMIITDHVMKTFSDPTYLPDKSEKSYHKIMKRRDIARWYLTELPTRTKEGFCILGCSFSLILSIYSYGKDASAHVADYLALILTLIVNEIIAHRWRKQRFHRLRLLELAD